VCGATTSKFLFNDKELGISICSKKCEYDYLNRLPFDKTEQMNVLRCLDKKIKANIRHKRIGWLIAGFGLFIVATGFFVSNVSLFLFGNIPLVIGALSTSHFSDKREKLLKLRKRIVI